MAGELDGADLERWWQRFRPSNTDKPTRLAIPTCDASTVYDYCDVTVRLAAGMRPESAPSPAIRTWLESLDEWVEEARQAIGAEIAESYERRGWETVVVSDDDDYYDYDQFYVEHPEEEDEYYSIVEAWTKYDPVDLIGPPPQPPPGTDAWLTEAD